MRYPTRFQQKTLWNAITGLSIVILFLILGAAIWCVGKVFGILQPVLIPLITAGIIAYVLEPVVRWLQFRGMRRFWAVITLFAGLVVAATLLVVAVLPGINAGREMVRNAMKFGESSAVERTIVEDGPIEGVSDELQLAAERRRESKSELVPALARSLRDLRQRHRGDLIGWALAETNEDGELLEASFVNGEDADSIEFFWNTRMGRTFLEYRSEILTFSRQWLSVGSSKLIGFLGLVLGMIMVPIYLFFFLKDSRAIRNHWHEYLPFKASRFKTELIETLQEINGYLISFFRGQVVVAFIDGILVGLALVLFGLPYGFLIGVFMAILGVVPYIGNILCLIPACIIAYLHAKSGSAPFDLGPTGYVGCIIGVFVVVQQINSLVTAPTIVSDSVGLHPLTVIFSMLFWTILLGGFVGALLAVPLTAAMKVLFRRFIWERSLYERAGAV